MEGMQHVDDIGEANRVSSLLLPIQRTGFVATSCTGAFDMRRLPHYMPFQA
jgi:hypothetical protein